MSERILSTASKACSFRRISGGGVIGLAMLVAGVVLLACAGSKPSPAPLLDEFQRYERDAVLLGPSGDAEEILEAGREKEAAGEDLLRQGKADQAWWALRRATGDARLALAMSEADRAAREADACLRQAERARRNWDEALQLLIETEQVARRTARDVPHEVPGVGDLGPRELPEPLDLLAAPAEFDLATVQATWDAWLEAARDRAIATADLEVRYRSHLEVLQGKSSDDSKALHRYLAVRTTQEVQARVRAVESQEVCRRASERIVDLAEARDRALRGTLTLERTLKDDLRGQLETARAEAEDRQNKLFEALQQIEGRFARITREARGTIVSLADILFDFDRATLKREVEFNLVRVATILNQFPEMQIAVEGHTDNIGTPEYNLDLSQRRAQAVHDFLASQGVDAGRMTVEGYGLTRPVDDNSTEEGRQRNRRVDLVIREEP